MLWNAFCNRRNKRQPPTSIDESFDRFSTSTLSNDYPASRQVPQRPTTWSMVAMPGGGSTTSGTGPSASSLQSAGDYQLSDMTAEQMYAELLDKDRLIETLEARVRHAEDDRDRFKNELDKVKSVLSLSHASSPLPVLLERNRRGSDDDAHLQPGGGGGGDMPSPTGEQPQRVPLPRVDEARTTGGAHKKVAISGESVSVVDTEEKLVKYDKDNR